MNFSVDIEEYFKMSDGNVLLIGMKEDCPTRERLLSCVVLCYVVFSYSNCADESPKDFLRLLHDSLNYFP